MEGFPTRLSTWHFRTGLFSQQPKPRPCRCATPELALSMGDGWPRGGQRWHSALAHAGNGVLGDLSMKHLQGIHSLESDFVPHYCELSNGGVVLSITLGNAYFC